MEKQIWKYAVEVKDNQSIAMPSGATILSIQEQHDQIQMWVLVDPKLPQEERKFKIYGTGHTIQYLANMKFIQTIPMNNGFVWHVFEEIKLTPSLTTQSE